MFQDEACVKMWKLLIEKKRNVFYAVTIIIRFGIAAYNHIFVLVYFCVSIAAFLSAFNGIYTSLPLQ